MEERSKTEWRAYGRLRAPAEQVAVMDVHRQMAKHDNDLEAALFEWQQQFTEQPEMVRAICDAFFHKEARLRRSGN